jgi:hypothetical protein
MRLPSVGARLFWRLEGDDFMCREIVLEFSVVIQWFSKEAKSDEALKLMDSYVEGSVELFSIGFAAFRNNILLG